MLQPSPQSYPPPPQSPSNNSTYTSSTSIDMGFPSSMFARSGVGKVIATNSSSTKSGGGPLSHLLGEDTSTDEEEVIPPVTSYSNSSTVPVSLIPPKPESELLKSRDLLIRDREVNIEPDDSIINSQNATTEEFEQYQPTSLPDPEDSPVPDWDSEQNHQRRFWARVMDQKRERRQELRLIEQKRQSSKKRSNKLHRLNNRLTSEIMIKKLVKPRLLR